MGVRRRGVVGTGIIPVNMKNIVILISGGGSNMAAIVRASIRDDWARRLGAKVVAVVSNKAAAGGLELARAQGLATEVVEHKAFAGAPDPRAAFDAQLAQVIDRYEPALVVLAGFMRILTPGFTSHYAGRMLNIHPSLLPAFTGLHTHRRALEMGCRFVGATVHFVTAELDHGAIVAQAVVAVQSDDDEASVTARVLALEHRMYPSAVRWFVEEQLAVSGEVVRHLGGESQAFS